MLQPQVQKNEDSMFTFVPRLPISCAAIVIRRSFKDWSVLCSEIEVSLKELSCLIILSLWSDITCDFEVLKLELY